MVRRLPVLQNPADDPDSVQRPRWQWVLVGSVAAIVFWVPLLLLAAPVGAALAAAYFGVSRDTLLNEDTMRDIGKGPDALFTVAVFRAAPALLSFLFSSAAAGALAAEFGRIRPRDCALSGLLGALCAVGLVVLQGGRAAFSAWTLAALLVLSSAGILGGAVGGAWRARKR